MSVEESCLLEMRSTNREKSVEQHRQRRRPQPPRSEKHDPEKRRGDAGFGQTDGHQPGRGGVAPPASAGVANQDQPRQDHGQQMNDQLAVAQADTGRVQRQRHEHDEPSLQPLPRSAVAQQECRQPRQRTRTGGSPEPPCRAKTHPSEQRPEDRVRRRRIDGRDEPSVHRIPGEPLVHLHVPEPQIDRTLHIGLSVRR